MNLIYVIYLENNHDILNFLSFCLLFPLDLLIILVLLPLQISASLITLYLVFFHDTLSNDEFFWLCTLGILFYELREKHVASAFLHDLFCLLESHLLDFVQGMRLKIPVFNPLLPPALWECRHRLDSRFKPRDSGPPLSST